MPANRTGPLLLASVVDAAEAAIALAAGVDVLDVKDPGAGPLGAPVPAILRAVVAARDAAIAPAVHGQAAGAARSHTPVSAALGDAIGPPPLHALAAAGAFACGAEFVKIALRGAGGTEGAASWLRAMIEGARAAAPRVRIVAATYAEGETVGAVPPGSLPALAERSGACGCLVDTFHKDGRTLFDVASHDALAGFVHACRDRGLLSALAGSIEARHLPRLVEIGPEVVGARGALCEGGRGGRLHPGRLSAFLEALRAGAGARTGPGG